MFTQLRRRETMDRRRSLAAVPVLNRDVRVEPIDGNLVALKISVARGTGLLARFRPSVSERRYELDEFGTFVLRQIDSVRSVLDIIRAFEQRFRLSHREAELGVVAFLKMLMKRRLLGVIADTDPDWS